MKTKSKKSKKSGRLYLSLAYPGRRSQIRTDLDEAYTEKLKTVMDCLTFMVPFDVVVRPGEKS